MSKKAVCPLLLVREEKNLSRNDLAFGSKLPLSRICDVEGGRTSVIPTAILFFLRDYAAVDIQKLQKEFAEWKGCLADQVAERLAKEAELRKRFPFAGGNRIIRVTE